MRELWCLDPGASLELGVWGLELPFRAELPWSLELGIWSFPSGLKHQLPESARESFDATALRRPVAIDGA